MRQFWLGQVRFNALQMELVAQGFGIDRDELSGAKSASGTAMNDPYGAMCNSQQLSQPPLALAVPLSRFTSRVGGGSAFFVRRVSVLVLWRDILTADFADFADDFSDVFIRVIRVIRGHNSGRSGKAGRQREFVKELAGDWRLVLAR